MGSSFFWRLMIAKFVVTLTMSAVVVSTSNGTNYKALPPCEFPAIYNFGDSNSDTGAISAAFFRVSKPYGVPYFHKPFARDSDGRLIIDFIAEKFKLPYLRAYLDSIGANYRHGANFATGGSTIRRQNETIFQNSISPFALDIQISQFDQFKARTTALYQRVKGTPDADKLPRPDEFAKALYTFDIGQNDLAVGFRTMTIHELRAVLPVLVSQLASAIQHVYKKGGRSFWIHNTGPFGCMPVNLFFVPNPAPGFLDDNGCVKAENEVSEEFNRLLKERVIELRKELPKAAITYVDVHAAKMALIANARSLGLADPLKACCGYHVNLDHIWCGTTGIVNDTKVFGGSCKDPSRYISWDGVHYTQFANKYVADHTQNGALTDPSIRITLACHRQYD